MRRSTSILLLIILTVLLISGCTFSIGRQNFVIRPGFRVPPRAVEKGDGEQVEWEELDPDGRSMFVFIRGDL